MQELAWLKCAPMRKKAASGVFFERVIEKRGLEEWYKLTHFDIFGYTLIRTEWKHTIFCSRLRAVVSVSKSDNQAESVVENRLDAEKSVSVQGMTEKGRANVKQ
jgi:hypothetical protein